MENFQLHEDILIEIFSRLPTKSVGKFRCLSKAWCTHLSTSQFINLHFTTRKTNQPKLFLKKFRSSFYISTPWIEDAGATTKVNLPFSSIFGGVDSFNGLVFIITEQQFIFVNPITLQHVQVPIPKSWEPRKLFGFGYDSCSDDYKIVIDHSSTLEVYSLKSKVWKRVSSSPKIASYKIASYKGLFTNGAIHWSSMSNGTTVIVAFNLSDEFIYYIPLPASARDWRFPCECLYILEGCLCVIDTSDNLKIDIWLMKEYRVQDSWTKFTVNTNNNLRIYRPLCFIGDAKIVLLTFHDGVIVYDLVEETAKDMIVDVDYTDGVAFSDSLVSLSSDQHVLSS